MPVRFRQSVAAAAFALALTACSPDRAIAPHDSIRLPHSISADIDDIAIDPVLYSQTSTINGLNSANGPGTTFAGDEFVVPAGQVWTVKSVILSGSLLQSTLFYSVRADVNGAPGPILFSATRAPDATDAQTCCSSVNDYLFTFPTSTALPAGRYWFVFRSQTVEDAFRFQPMAIAQGSKALISVNGGSDWTELSAAGIAFSLFGSAKLTQTITFDPATPNAGVTGTSVEITAIASSGLAVMLAAGPSNVCTLSGVTLSLLAAGTCTVTADQAGNEQYVAAVRATHDIHVEDAPPLLLEQSITFPEITPNPTFVGATASLDAMASSNLLVSYTSLTPGVCSVTGSTVQASDVGMCVVAADQAGNATYAPAPRVTQTLKVDYRFSGFLDPVSSTAMNSVKAGRTIPLKWRVTDTAGIPVTSLTTATITVIDLSCTSSSTSNQVEESTAGASGLQNLGDGYYQLNWKAPASYAKSCKTLQLELGEGSGVRTASFTFTK